MAYGMGRDARDRYCHSFKAVESGEIPDMKRVFSKFKYVSLAFLVALTFLLVTALWVEGSLIRTFAYEPAISLGEAARRSLYLIVGFYTDLSLTTLCYLVVTALFIGVNFALAAAVFKIRKFFPKSGTAATLFGTLSGALGFGCAACGTFFLGALFSGTSGAVIATIPYENYIFSGAGIILMALSTYLLVKTINAPATCPI